MNALSTYIFIHIYLYYFSGNLIDSVELDLSEDLFDCNDNLKVQIEDVSKETPHE